MPRPSKSQKLSAWLREQIQQGTISTGTRLPATRSLAADLGLSRTTVVVAYDQLVAEGYLTSKAGAGYHVSALGSLPTSETLPDSAATAASTPAKQPLLAPGVPDLRLFPTQAWARAVGRAARQSPESLITIGDPFGDLRLRQAICDYLRLSRGLSASTEQVIITAGSGDALELALRTLCPSPDWIGLEDPGYLPIRHFVQSLQHQVCWLALDAQGARLPTPEQTPAAVVITPSHQFPLGGAMSIGRRQEFIAWATAQSSWLIEDDYDSEFRYAGEPIPTLAGLDRANRTIYVGSFSKLFSASLRLGYMVVPQHQISAFRHSVAQIGTKASSLPQAPLGEFIDSGAFQRHIRRMRRVYGERRRVLVQALTTLAPLMTRSVQQAAGMQLLLQLPDRCDDVAIATELSRHGIMVRALSSYYVTNAARGLLLGFCANTEEELKDATTILLDQLAANDIPS